MVSEMATVFWKSVAASAITLYCINMAYADTERSGFYTIVGPDGQMIVIDRNAASKNDKKVDKQNSTGAGSKWSFFRKTKKSDEIKSIPPVTPSVSISRPAPVGQSSVDGLEPVTTQPVTKQPLNRKPVAAPPTAVAQPEIITQQAQLSIQQPGQPVKQAANATLPLAIPSANRPVHQTGSTIESASRSTVALSEQSAATNSKPVTVIDGEQYIDSEYLEQREFNLEGKKRFYNLPDGIGGHEVLEREKGVDMTVFRKQKIDKPQVVDLSKNYQRIPQADIIALTGTRCFSNKQLKGAKLFKPDEHLDFWPRPGFEPKFDFVVAKLAQPMTDIQFSSYANNTQNPKFYWPLPIFLDNQGCVLEGVNAFYQTTVAPTVTMHQAIQGYLHIPSNTAYILFTPLEAAADLSETQLTNKGQFRLTPIR